MDEREHALPRLSDTQSLERSGAPASEPSGEVRARVANAMVGLKKEHFGRGPTAAKAWMLDDYLFVAMEGGLTRNEETLLAAGREDAGRAYRLTVQEGVARPSRLPFREVVAATSIAAVEEITGREVANYHSQIVFGPTRAFEIFT